MAASGLSQHALLVDVAAKVLADNITALNCLAVQGDVNLPEKMQCQRTHAALVVQRILPCVLLAIGDVLDLFDSALAVIARTRHRITPERSALAHPTGPSLMLVLAKRGDRLQFGALGTARVRGVPGDIIHRVLAAAHPGC